MRFAAAIVIQLFEKIVVCAVKLSGVDVLAINTEYGFKGSPEWRRSFLECLNETFHFGGDKVKDSRFAFGCSASIINGYDYLKNYVKLWDRNPPTVDTSVSGCAYGSPEFYNGIDDVLKWFRERYVATFRKSASVVTFIFADENLKNDIETAHAKLFVEWPNQLYLAIEVDTSGKEADLAKNGVDRSNLLKFTIGKCPDMVNELQHLMCRGEPKKGNCEHSTSDPIVCHAEVLSYQPSRLQNAANICAEVLVAADGEKVNCVCYTTVLSTATSAAATSVNTAVKKSEDNHLSWGKIVVFVVGVIILTALVVVFVGCCVFRRKGGSSELAGAKGGSRAAAASGSKWSPSRHAEGHASRKFASKPQKSVSKPQTSVSKPAVLKPHKSVWKPSKSVSKQRQKWMKSVGGGQSKTGGSKMAKSRMSKK